MKTTRGGTGVSARVVIQSGISGVKDQRAFFATVFDGNSGADGTLTVNLPWSSIPGVGEYRFRIIDLQTGQVVHERYATVPNQTSAIYEALGILPPSIDTEITSAQLAATISDETGAGSLVFADTPTLISPILGTPTSGTLTNCTGYSFSALVIADMAVARSLIGAAKEILIGTAEPTSQLGVDGDIYLQYVL